MCKSSVGVQPRGQKPKLFDPKGAVRPLAIGHWSTVYTGPRNPQARRSRSRSLARLAQAPNWQPVHAAACGLVVVVLRTPPAELGAQYARGVPSLLARMWHVAPNRRRNQETSASSTRELYLFSSMTSYKQRYGIREPCPHAPRVAVLLVRLPPPPGTRAPPGYAGGR